MQTLSAKDIFEVMKERSSVRQYKKGVTLPKETLDEVLNAAATAPSSWNLQHWKFIVIQDSTRKEELVPIAFGQQQVADASAVIVILGDTEANKNGENVYANASEKVKETLLGNIEYAYTHVPHFGVHEAIRNASFAAMQLMLAAKALDLDTCPMGGFDPSALRQKLNIPDRYIPVLMLTIGYAEAPAHPTERFPLEDLVIAETF